jgi:hypothetical protein
MNTKTLRNLSVTGIVASLLVAASPASAYYERHFGYGLRYGHLYRPAMVVPSVAPYGYRNPRPTVYYAPPRAYVPVPAYYGSAPVYYGAPAYHGTSMGFGVYGGRRGHGRGYGYR